MRKKLKHMIGGAIIFLVFLSVFPYGSEAVWFEAIVFSAIFILSIFAVLRGGLSEIEGENKFLLAPVLLLSAYSFLQFFVTLLIQNDVLKKSNFLPDSLDPAASFWNGFAILAFACFIFLLLTNFRNRLYFLVHGLVVTGNFFAALGIARFFLQKRFPQINQFFFLPQLDLNVGFGTFINQNHFAFLMLMTFGLNAALFWLGNLSKEKRLGLFFLSLLSWTALVLTASRGGIISSFVEIAVLIFLSSQFKEKLFLRRRTSKFQKFGKSFAAFLVISAALVVGVFLIGQNRVLHRFGDLPEQLEATETTSGFRRTDVWKAAIEIIRENPVYGIGFGNFGIAVSKYIDISGELVPNEAHNDYLEFAASGGLFALAFGVWFLLRFFQTAKKRFDETDDFFDFAARVGALCGIGGAAFHSLFDFGLQITANLLFFGALIAIVCMPQTKDFFQKSDGKITAQKIFVSLLLIISVICSLLFGYSRLRLHGSRQLKNAAAFENQNLKIPFDAEFYKTKAEVYINAGDYISAADELKKAVRLRPDDYSLHLKLGRILQNFGQTNPAENAFRRAVQLAPFYGAPHFEYGKFLISSGRKKEGFDEMRFASRRNSKYFESVIESAWNETGGSIAPTIEILSPFESVEREILAGFLFERKQFSAIVKTICQTDDLPEKNRGNLVRKLFDENRFYYAAQIERRECDYLRLENSDFENGDFETVELRKGRGFGWRIDDFPPTVKVFYDNEVFESGKNSLGFSFDGKVNGSTDFLSQTIVVKQNASYRISFFYKSNELKTGGVPLLEVFIKSPESENKIREIELPAEATDWKNFALEFQSGKKTEAVEIRLTRKSCGERTCPIFGKLWVDSFRLLEIKK